MTYPMTPRKWQNENYEEFQYKPKKLTWLIRSCTGAGKTFGACMLIHSLKELYPDLLVLVVAPLDAVREGWVNMLDVDETLEPPVDMFLWPTETRLEEFDPRNDDCYVTTYQGLGEVVVMSLKAAGRPVVIVFDEIHRLEESVKEGQAHSAWTKDAVNAITQLEPVKIISLTATPWREGSGVRLPESIVEYYPDELPEGHPDKEREGTVKADKIHTYGDELMEGKKSGVVYATFKPRNARCQRSDGGGGWEWIDTAAMPDYDPVHAKSYPFGLTPFVKLRNKKEYTDRPYVEQMIKSAIRTLHIMRTRKHRGIKGAVFAMDIDSALYLQQVLKDKQQEAIVVHSRDTPADTKKKLKAAKSEDGPAWIISVGMLGEGVDIPPIKVIVDLSDERTLRSIIQRWGRALRKFKGAPDTNAKIYHLNHSVLRFASETLKQEIQIAKQEPGTGGGNGPGEPRFYREFSDSDEAGSLLDEERFLPDVDALAEWLYECRETISDYTDALKIAREMMAMGVLPPEYVRPTKTSKPRSKQSRTKKRDRKDLTREHLRWLWANKNPEIDAGVFYEMVNKEVKGKLINKGLTPNTPKYKKARAEMIEKKARSYGWEEASVYDFAQHS
jgi:superfamily II DNA or RNA helicase